MKLRTSVLALISVCLCIATSVAVSQMQAPAQMQTSPQAQKLQALSKQLNLTPEQKMKLLPILQSEAPKLEAIKSNTSLGPMQKMQQMKALHAEYDPQIQKILTPAQFEQLQGIRQQEIKDAIEKKRADQP